MAGQRAMVGGQRQQAVSSRKITAVSRMQCNGKWGAGRGMGLAGNAGRAGERGRWVPMFLQLTWEASIDAGKARERSGLEVVTASRSGQLGGSSQKFFQGREVQGSSAPRAAAGWSGVDFMEPRKSRAPLSTYPRHPSRFSAL